MYKFFAEKNNLAKRIEDITIALTNVVSVTESEGEKDITKTIYDIFAGIDYYKEHPEDLYIQNLPEDRLKRNNVIAILRGGKGNSKKAVSLLGHFDTVDIADFGSLIDFANKPYELTEKYKERIGTLLPEVKEDLQHEDQKYLFGRGILDMKSGVAVHIAIIEGLAKDIDNFEGNLVFVGVCDEEVGSAGMFGAVKELNKIVDETGWQIQGMIDTDYMTGEYPGDEDKYVYVGTVGKLLPSFYVVGSEAHVGETFKGIDANQIAAEVIRRINMNPEFCDEALGQTTLPPISLRQRDLKAAYSVQTAKAATVFFNYATHKSNPDEVMKKMVDAAKEAMQEAIDNLNNQYKKFCKLVGIEHKELPWVARVITYTQLYNAVKREKGEKLDEAIKGFEASLITDTSLDERDYSLKLVEKIHSMWSIQDPVIISYFSPPYYPHIVIEGKDAKEQNVLRAVKRAVDETKSQYNLVYKNFFPFIADISYAAAPRDSQAIKSLKNNMPGFGTKYILPLDEMSKLNLPVLNIGPFGKDAHKSTERVETNYSFNTTPELVYRTVINLLEG